MKGVVGFRDVQVFSNVVSGSLATVSQYIEVTNSNATDTIIYLNDFPEQGHPTLDIASKGIPIKAGTTREIPMQVYNFSATNAVTVIAYIA